jgi:hypothetical protein
MILPRATDAVAITTITPFVAVHVTVGVAVAIGGKHPFPTASLLDTFAVDIIDCLSGVRDALNLFGPVQ